MQLNACLVLGGEYDIYGHHSFIVHTVSSDACINRPNNACLVTAQGVYQLSKLIPCLG